jgi:hypothetical protein
VLRGATIAFDGNGCTVRNLSTTGAGLDFASAISLPSSCMLLIEADESSERRKQEWAPVP